MIDAVGGSPLGGGESPRALPLENVLVADFSRVLAGPLCTMLLADMGAEVIKIEQPGRGDESREWGPPFFGTLSTYYAAVNRNKRVVTLDLGDSDDRAAALDLVDRAHVLVENFRPGTIERLGLGYEIVSERNPGLVYCAISAFGREGGAHLPGYDFLLQATSGLMSITGQPDGPPTKVGVALVDVIAGLFATIGVLGALHERRTSDSGQRVDVSLLSASLIALVNQASAHVMTGTVPERMGNAHPSVAPYELFETADEPLVIAVGNDRQFAGLAEALGASELAADPRFATNRLRVENLPELRHVLSTRLRVRPRDEWIERLRVRNVACGPVNDIAEAFALAEKLGLDPIVEIASASGVVRQVANPLAFSGTPVRYHLSPPELGTGDGVLDSIRRRFPAHSPLRTS